MTILLTDKPKATRICLACESGNPITTGAFVQYHNYDKPNQMVCANSTFCPDNQFVAPSETVYE